MVWPKGVGTFALLILIRRGVIHSTNKHTHHTTQCVGGGDVLDLATFISTGQENGEPTFYDAMVASVVQMHQSVGDTSNRLAKRGNATQNFISPRDYLDFIQHFR